MTRFLLTVAGGFFLLAGCTSSQLGLSAESRRPISTRTNHVVMAAGEMEDADTADRLIAAIERSLREKGFRTNLSREAGIVVVGNIVKLNPQGAESPLPAAEPKRKARPVAPSSPDVMESVALFAMQPPDRPRGGVMPAGSNEASVSPSEVQTLRMILKAVALEEWLKPERTFETLTPLWSVTVEGHVQTELRSAFVEAAVAAAADYIGKNAKAVKVKAPALDAAPERNLAGAPEVDFTLDPLPQ